MYIRGFSTNIILAIVGVLIIIGAATYATLNGTPQSEPEMPIVPGDGQSPTVNLPPETGTPVATPSKPSGGQSTATSPKPSVSKPSSTGSIPQTPAPAPAPAPYVPQEVVPEPAPTPDPIPTPAPYNPGFLATSRVTPEIPSENERATLPACDIKLLPANPVEYSLVASISADGKMNTAGIPDYAILRVTGSGELNKYDLYSPGDVWITHIAQETGISADPEDTTIYFAICRDIVGYVTHVKELSADMYKFITDSYCLGKPHTGPNACKIEVLKQVSQGQTWGKVGRIEGSFGIGIIDLRKDRGLANAASLPIKTNFAACPFDYFVGKTGFYTKLTGSSSLCTVQ